MQELLKDLDYKCYVIADLAKDGIIAAGNDEEIIHIFNRILSELGEPVYNPHDIQEETSSTEHIISVSNLEKEIKNIYNFSINVKQTLGFYIDKIFVHNVGKYYESEEITKNLKYIDSVLKVIFGEDVEKVTIVEG